MASNLLKQLAEIDSFLIPLFRSGDLTGAMPISFQIGIAPILYLQYTTKIDKDI